MYISIIFPCIFLFFFSSTYLVEIYCTLAHFLITAHMNSTASIHWNTMIPYAYAIGREVLLQGNE